MYICTFVSSTIWSHITWGLAARWRAALAASKFIIPLLNTRYLSAYMASVKCAWNYMPLNAVANNMIKVYSDIGYDII